MMLTRRNLLKNSIIGPILALFGLKNCQAQTLSIPLSAETEGKWIRGRDGKGKEGWWHISRIKKICILLDPDTFEPYRTVEPATVIRKTFVSDDNRTKFYPDLVEFYNGIAVGCETGKAKIFVVKNSLKNLPEFS